MDIVDQLTRSRMMAGIKGVNTKPEMYVRSRLHKLGFRFRVNVSNIPGKPDLVFRRYKALVFVQGCFWHGHGCHLFKWPATRREFWKKKIQDTCKRDLKNFTHLQKAGWRLAVVWECELGKAGDEDAHLINSLAKWLRSMKKTNF